MKIKALLYCTKAKPYLQINRCVLPTEYDRYILSKEQYYSAFGEPLDKLNGKIIAECDFEVDKLTNCGTSFMIMKYDNLQESYRYTNKVARGSCLDYTDLRRYLGTKDGYAIHIKNLHIFDEPQRLTRLTKINWEENISECFAKKGKCNFGYSERYGNWIGCIKAQIDKAPKNMMRVIDWNGETKILISVSPQEMCRIANKEQTVLVRKRVLKEYVR